ncbi:hypothetical protein QBC32DRAFT_337808 [Pseudoneurospora amorphoporcata]|uniref:Uncharacterized protein n=1 Tax=Pseudoneurospora amorphoporcata TaxID=241081 RepID=A0AAN6NZP3_9PEZI|nr:hypothetical protein QBC32DRAFT_337808 [Pseudoneurospora amorphoporcata]
MKHLILGVSSPVWSAHLSPVLYLLFSSQIIKFAFLSPTLVHYQSAGPMDSARGTVSYEGRGDHNLNDHIDESPQHPSSGVHILEENVPLHDQVGRTDSRSYSKLRGNSASLEELDSDNHEYPWRPGGFRHFPYLGYISLFLSMACTGLAIFIIHLSDGQLVSEWAGSNRAQPGVLLALTSTTANTLMMISYAQGWVSFFWTQALKGNMPLSYIHYNWEAATSVWGAIKSLIRRRALRVSIVSILVATTSSLRGPLIQKASYIRTREVFPKHSMPVQVCPTTEIWTASTPDHARFRSIFLDVMRDYQDRAPIFLPGSEHCTNCSLTVKALGFRHSEPVLISHEYDFFQRPSDAKVKQGDVYGVDIFEVHTTAVGNGDHLNVSVTRKTSEQCETEVTTTSIRLYPSRVEYDLFVDRGNATFVRSSTATNNSNATQIVLSSGEPGEEDIKLIYFADIGNLLWGSRTHFSIAWGDVTMGEPIGLRWNFPTPDPGDPNGTVWSYIDYAGAASFLYERVSPNETAKACGPAFDDPLEDILNTYRELALRLSIHEGMRTFQEAIKAKIDPMSLESQQVVNYTSHQYLTEYAANWAVLAIAVTFSLLGPIAILFLFQDWYTLGRSFSFSPFELANALLPRSLPPSSSSRSTSSDDNDSIFELKQRQHQLASLIANCSSNASAEQMVELILKTAGADSTRSKEPAVQYGVLDGTGLLGFAISDANGVVHARKPRKGEML